MSKSKEERDPFTIFAAVGRTYGLDKTAILPISVCVTKAAPWSMAELASGWNLTQRAIYHEPELRVENVILGMVRHHSS